MDTAEILGNRLQKIRRAKKITQDELAERVGVSPHFISDIERGVKKPTILTLIQLMRSLETTPNEVFCDVIATNHDVTNDIIEIFSELPQEDRAFLLGVMMDYKRLFDKKQRKN